MMNPDLKLPKYLDRGLQASLFLLAFAAPMSIAGTQIAWSIALLIWIVRAFVIRPSFRRSGVDLAILAFVGLTVLSSVFSYEPEVSIRKLMSVSLVTIVYLISGNIRGKSLIQKLTAVLIIASTFTAVFAIGNFLVGRNLKVTSLAATSPLRTAVSDVIPGGVLDNDTIVKANGKSVSTPENLLAAIRESGSEPAKIDVYRVEITRTYVLPTTGINSVADLGIDTCTRGRDVRAAAFYGHYTTFAEAIQLVMSLAFGFLIAMQGGLFSRNRILLAAVVAAFCGAMFLTLTRASWAGFAVSAAVIVLLGTSKRTVLICAALAIPLAIGGLYYLQQKRNVAFIDTSDNSTTWRLTVWREGVDLLLSKPKHLIAGVGMDSLKNHWQEWHLFDEGRLPMGHMHSTPLQFALERGIPTLIAWIVWMFLYLRMLYRGLRSTSATWAERGQMLGAIGGTIGFLTSGLVHYNWGDSEVVMIFYIIMGLSFATLRSIDDRAPISSAAQL